MANVYRSKSKSGKPHAKWRFQYVDWQGKRRTATGSTSKAETQKLAASVEAKHDAIRRGLKPPPQSFLKHRQRPFSEAVAEYIAWGESQGGIGGRPWGVDHARVKRARLKWWEDRLDLECLGDLQRVLPKVEEALRDLQAEGKAGKTIQGYAEALRAFCNWAEGRGFIDGEPLKRLQQFEASPKMTRRSLTMDEIQRLLSAAPPHRALLYETALCSGLRRRELRALMVSDLSRERGGLLLRAEWTKNRRPGCQPLPPDLIDHLAAFAEAQTAKELYARHYRRKDVVKDFPADPLLFVSRNTGREFAKDATKAKIPRTNPAGVADFHALRTTFINLTIELGGSVKEVQALARHSTPDLSLNTYGRTRSDRLSGIAEALGNAIQPKECRAFAERRVVGLHNQGPATTYENKGVGSSPTPSAILDS